MALLSFILVGSSILGFESWVLWFEFLGLLPLICILPFYLQFLLIGYKNGLAGIFSFVFAVLGLVL